MGTKMGRIGVWTSYRSLGEENAGEAARLVEELGFGAFWLGASPRLPTVRPLLQATTSLAVATGIVNVWQYDPSTLAAEYAALRSEFSDRLLLGVGIGHPEATSDYSRPLSTIMAFLDGLDTAGSPVAREERCLAALGPKMLDLSASRSRGAHTYFVPAAHTRYARERLGNHALLATELACVVDTDAERARITARTYAKLYLGLRNYTSNLLKLGFGEADIAGGGSDRLIDTIVPHGTPDQIAAAAREHLAAGADHVCLQPVGVQGIPRQEWRGLAAALKSELGAQRT